jgi:hypothetical protein
VYEPEIAALFIGQQKTRNAFTMLRSALPGLPIVTQSQLKSYLRAQTGKLYGFVENSMTVCDCVPKRRKKNAVSVESTKQNTFQTKKLVVTEQRAGNDANLDGKLFIDKRSIKKINIQFAFPSPFREK